MQKKHGFSFGASIAASCFWLVAIILYGLAIWGSASNAMVTDSVYVIQLSMNSSNATQGKIDVKLGFYGLCVTKPFTSGNETELYCDVLYDKLDYNETQAKLFNNLIDEMDVEDQDQDPAYNATMGRLLQQASILHHDVFDGGDLVAAVVLLFVGGLTLMPPLFFYSPHRRNVIILLTSISSILLGAGLMAAGAGVFTTLRTAALLEDSTTLGFGESVAVRYGRWHRGVMIGALALNGLYLLLAAAIMYARHKKTPGPLGGVHGPTTGPRPNGRVCRLKPRVAGLFPRKKPRKNDQHLPMAGPANAARPAVHPGFRGGGHQATDPRMEAAPYLGC